MSYVSVENRACLYGYSATYPFFGEGDADKILDTFANTNQI